MKAFEELEEYVDPSLESSLEYVEDNYIGRRQRHPVFPHRLVEYVRAYREPPASHQQ